MQKYRDAQITAFSFSDLKGDHVVGGTQFEAFSFKSLTTDEAKTGLPSQDEIRQERSFEQKTSFRIDEIVRDYRGLSKQEQNDLETRIQTEVKKRLESAHQEAYKAGLEKGRTEGKEKALAQYQEELSQKVEEFTQVIAELNVQSQAMVSGNVQEIREFVKRFTKWIVLKEINEKVYLETLLEKLILELNARKNLIVKVGRANFGKMPEVIQTVEARLGQLSNIRVEIVPELQHPGIILESENGLIDGSIEGVFQNIDKIFQQVLNHE